MSTEDNLLMSTCPVVDSTLVAIYWEKRCENVWSLMNGENLQLAKIRDIPLVLAVQQVHEREPAGWLQFFHSVWKSYTM